MASFSKRFLVNFFVHVGLLGCFDNHLILGYASKMYFGAYRMPLFRPSVEIRKYEPYIVAETTVEASTKNEATSQGFRLVSNLLFRYLCSSTCLAAVVLQGAAVVLQGL